MIYTSILALLGGLLLAAPTPPPAVATSSTIRPDCGPDSIKPAAWSRHRGTITINRRGGKPCIVPLPAGATLDVSPAIAPPPAGRAIFRVSGGSIDGPGGIVLDVRASSTGGHLDPETSPALHADAIVHVPRGAALLRYDPATGICLAVPHNRIRLAATYTIVLTGMSCVPIPATPLLPTTLPATGSGLLAILFLPAAALFLAGLALLRRGDPVASRRRRRRAGWAAIGAGIIIAGATGLTYAFATREATAGGEPLAFGAFTHAGPLSHLTPASSPPTRLAIARIGVDTPVIPLDVSSGAWQVPAFAAGYLRRPDWAAPGGNGALAIAGHDDRDGAVFQRLGELHGGDVVRVYAGERVYRYRVTARRVVAPAHIDVLRQTRGATLVLITCTPYLIDTQRLVVQAQLIQ